MAGIPFKAGTGIGMPAGGAIEVDGLPWVGIGAL
jgi:hypothetical protein